jgi:hypothetical protein
LQVAPQLAPLHVAVPFGGFGQGVQELPQLLTLVFDTHCPEQSWKPELQAMPQLLPSQVAVPFAGFGQGVQEVPQPSTLVFGTHLPPQA